MHTLFFLSPIHEWITREKLGAWYIKAVHSAELEELNYTESPKLNKIDYHDSLKGQLNLNILSIQYVRNT